MGSNSIVFAGALVFAIGGLCVWDKLTRPRFASELLKACHFAAIKHVGQTQQNAAEDPFITHPIRVSQIIAELSGQGDNLPLLQAGLLHDTVYDTDTTLEEIEREFGPRVRQIVAQHTRDKSLPEEEQKRLQVASAPNLTYEAKILLVSDKIAKLEDMLLGANGENIPVGYRLGDNGEHIPVGWSVGRVQKYVALAMEVGKGTGLGDGPLMSRLKELAAGQFEHFDGNKYAAML